VALAQEGNKNAFGVLAERYRAMTQRFAMRLIADEEIVCELAQEAILQAYLSLGNLRNPEKFWSWLCGIVLNVCRSYIRGRKITFFSLEAMMNGMQLFAVPLFNVPATPERITEERELHQIVVDAIEELPPKDRDVMLLFYYAQLNLREIVTVLDTSVGNVKVRLHRSRRRLREILQTQHPEIVPLERRRKKMVKVTVADIVRQEKQEEHEGLRYVIVLRDEAGKRALPIWIGVQEGRTIAAGLNEFTAPRPMTVNLFVNMLQAIGAQVQEIRIEQLKDKVFYAIVRIRNGKMVKEVDARPSDAIAVAVLTGSPIAVAEDVMEIGGIDIPEKVSGSAERIGVDSIVTEVEDEWWQFQSQLAQPVSVEEILQAKEEVIAAVFGK
jgi:RNA polymerase sigma factor (sigma-70 family)